MTDWVILRVASRQTMRLAQSLGEIGMDAWTPTESIIRKARRSHPREERTEALMPSYVFARAQHQPDLIALTHSPSLQYRVWNPEKRRMAVRGHPHFWLMQGQDTPFASVSEAQLSPLRRISERRRPKQSTAPLNNGDRIRMTEGCYAGLYGVVEDSRGPFPEVLLDGWAIPVRLAKWLLHPTLDAPRTHGVTSPQALSAKAA